jgi:hypothetical protein
MIGREFLDWMRDCQLLKKDCFMDLLGFNIKCQLFSELTFSSQGEEAVTHLFPYFTS